MITTKYELKQRFHEKIRKELSIKLPVVFSKAILGKQLQQMYRSGLIAPETKTAILKKIREIPLKWNKKVEYKLLTFDLNKVQVIDIWIGPPLWLPRLC